MLFFLLLASAAALPLAPSPSVFTGSYVYYPNQTEVDAITALDDTYLRNLCITQGYLDYTRAMTQFLSTEEAAWTGFAVWASYSVGFGISNKTLTSLVDLRIKKYHPEIAYLLEKFPWARIELYDQLMAHASPNLARGNQIVFHEVGTAMTGLLSQFGKDVKPDFARLDAFLNSTFKPLPAPAGNLELMSAVRAYYSARFEPDTISKSQLIALGNALIGVDEQTLLQDALDGAFQPLVITLPKALGGKVYTFPMEGIMTEMFGYYLPNEYLLVAEDMKRAPNASTDFPENLSKVTNADLLALFSHFRVPLDTLEGSKTYDWLVLEQRMRYVMDLMRTRQFDRAMWYCPPFTPDQREAIYRHKYPSNMTLCLANCACDWTPIPH